MAHQAEFQRSLLEGFRQFGSIYSVSRNNNVQLKIYSEAEQYLAQINQAEAAVTVSSGLLAGQIVARLFADCKCIYAPNTHPALWSSKPFHSPFTNYADFAANICQVVKKNKAHAIALFCNSIDPLMCCNYNFNWITQLPENKDITIVIDDSHSMGMVRATGHEDVPMKHGKGTYSLFRKLAKCNIRVIVVASMAKAMGIAGGIILGEQGFIQQVKKSPLFTGASPIIPAFLYALMKSEKTYLEAYEVLLKNISTFKENNSDLLHHFRYIDDYPVFYTKENKIFTLLEEKGIIISSFSYPSPEDLPLTRIVLSALHSPADIATLSEALHEIL
jgi:7-keto-8-aminopelargonate synthetase-like enzyme